MTETITITPAMRRLNAAVEQADYLTRYLGDRLSVDQLAPILRAWPENQSWCKAAANELLAARAAVEKEQHEPA